MTDARERPPFPDLPDAPRLLPGTVWLVGAGPGDPGLLTLNAYAALAQADVVVHDALVDPRILAWAPEGAAIQHAGKRGGKPSARQPDISESLVAHARAGARVVRLKGGDPFVFGRGAEEAAALAAAGVAVGVVPGVTAGIGGLAAAGIPLTSRETNAAVLFLTGHDRAGAAPGAVDWRIAARAAPVIVCYMALGTLDGIAEALVAGGRNPSEPVAIVSDATLPGQRVLETTLARAAWDVARERIAPPAIVVIGPVVALRETLGLARAMAPP